MENLLKEIAVIPGVRATFVFARQSGVVCAELDTDFPEEQAEQAALYFYRLVQMAGINKLDIKSTSFRFDRYSVVCFPLEKGKVLLTVCDAQANSSLVAATAAMLIDDLLLEGDSPG
jgi:hypothetical protein